MLEEKEGESDMAKILILQIFLIIPKRNLVNQFFLVWHFIRNAIFRQKKLEIIMLVNFHNFNPFFINELTRDINYSCYLIPFIQPNQGYFNSGALKTQSLGICTFLQVQYIVFNLPI